MFQIRVQAPGEDGAAAMFDDGVYGEEAKISEEEKSSSVSPLLPQHRGLDSALQREEEDGDGEDKQWPDANFLTGNPQVRVTTGKLRFYRPDQPYVHKLSPFAATTATSSAYQQLPHERNTLLCIVTVPSHMSPVELLEFLAGFRDDIASVRVLQDPDRSNCMALLQFVTQDRADQFFMAHNGTYFNSIEQERCKIVFVRSIEYDSVVDGAIGSLADGYSNHEQDEEVSTVSVKSPKLASKRFPPPPPGMTEIPTCAVCLDRLDASASGILTTLCNHTFHCDCLFRWEGSSCPVCRYSHGDIVSACEVCHTTEHLWICLICGHVGCGRYSGEHAKQHFQETSHTYSLELETQRVWDYAGDGYVHRLILNKQDGKFVEFPNPSSVSGERSQVPPTTAAEQEEGEHLKLEKLAVEYNFLLKSQLEEQRLFYERRLAAVNESDHRQLVQTLENDKKQLKKANETLAQKAHKLEEELTFVRELNKSLIENQKQWKERVRVLEEQSTRNDQDTTMRIADLEGQVRDLMFYLDTQNRVAQSDYRDDIQGGTVQIETRPAAREAAASSSTTTARRKPKSKR
uniref:BRCA1-associated protein n=1 Tax=Globisporangium ultimum (strain ATCC 200006 / CBS 805.95 / DAOM BR144) TaxID=431595 RepID=K3W6P2_GLOUD